MTTAMRNAIDAGLRAFCSETGDFDMSSAMRRSAVDHIMGQPGMFPGTGTGGAMIEKMARALAFRNTPGGTRARAEWAEMQWPHYVADAKTALVAMKEPSEAMKDAGGCVTFHEYERYYRAMIQAALDEKEE